MNTNLSPLEGSIEPEKRGRGRPRALPEPPMPDNIKRSLTPLERQHLDYFKRSIIDDYPDLSASDLIMLNLAALEYVNVLRSQAKTLETGEMLSQSKQNPGLSLRAYLEMSGCTRKQRAKVKAPENNEVLDALLNLSE